MARNRRDSETKPASRPRRNRKAEPKGSADREIDYQWEGEEPPRQHRSRTDIGYDQAARSGESRFGMAEGEGGVFGTTGGGTSDGGFREVDVASWEMATPSEPTRHWGSVYGRGGEHFDEVMLETTGDMPGPHMGKGPKDYRRADPRILDEIHERMTAHGFLDASELEVKVEDGEVTLSGSVPSREMKRLAADLCHQVAGVREVFTLVRVLRSRED